MKESLDRFIDTEIDPSALLITCGLPVTCKTPIAEKIAKAKGHHILRTDWIRRELFKETDIFDEKVAADMKQRAAVYDETLKQAEAFLSKGDRVIIDATFITQSLRRRTAELASRYGRKLVIVQTQCPREVSFRRIKIRTKEDYESNALTKKAYINNEQLFEQIDLDDLKRLYPNLDIIHLIVDTQYDAPEKWQIIIVEKRLGS